MNISELSKGDAIAVVEWFDSPAFTNIIAKCMEGEQDLLLRRLIESVNPEGDARLKGRIEQLTDFLMWRQIAYESATQKISEEST